MRCRACGPGPGFTLIEVTLGLGILVLIFGVIFQLVQMSVLGADAAGQNSRRCREISGLFALVRQLCLDLPVRSQLRFEPRTGGSPGYDLVMSNAPLAIMPEKPGATRTLRLAFRKDPSGGGGALSLQEIFQATNELGQPSSPETNTFLLLREVVSLRWLAGDPRNPEELSEWQEGVKPAYLKLELVRRDAGRNLTNTGIFWIPTGYGPSGQPPVDPVTRGPLAMTNATNATSTTNAR